MTPDQVQQRLLELIHREPFTPFEIELRNGQTISILHSRLAINDDGASFIGQDGGIVDFDFADISNLRCDHVEALA